jgi:hypothetical protein
MAFLHQSIPKLALALRDIAAGDDFAIHFRRDLLYYMDIRREGKRG